MVDRWVLFYNGITEPILTANNEQIINDGLYEVFLEDK
jgi:hypothetical protein